MINYTKIMQWIRLTFSSSKAVSFNRQLSVVLVVFLMWFGFDENYQAMTIVAGLIFSALGFTSIKKG